MSTTHPEVVTSTQPATLVESDIVTTSGARRALAVSRFAVGFIFLWAFLDKTFGLHYSTGAPVEGGTPSLSWLNGGTPAQGFMTHAATGPFADTFAALASPAADWLFMLGMLGVGAAVMLGIGLRVSAVAGSLIMLMMWAAEWPFIQGTTNPLVDYHIIYALALIVFAVTYAGDTWGLGRWWAQLPLVKSQTWLR